MKKRLGIQLGILTLVLLMLALPLSAGSTSFPRAATKALTAGSATPFVSISLPASGTRTAGIVYWSIEADDGTDYQTRTAMTYFNAVNKAGTITCSVGDVGTTVVALSASTLTNTMTCVAGTGAFTIAANAASGLTETTLRIRYRILDILGPSTGTGQ